ncbi:MAG: ABC transporter substrate-binding protein [Acidobacteria bacterium]|nr:ABC transporter substrate-binding protein [Acidobacteriota bacterium]
MREIKAAKKVVAGWAPYAPYCFKNPKSGALEGFYIDLFSRFTQEAGLSIVWVETTWGTMISDLKAGKFQVMAAPVFRTIPRSLEVAFTRSIDFFGYSAIAKVGDSRFKRIQDLNRTAVRIAVTQGEVGHEFAQRHLPKGQLVVHKSGDISLALVDVIQGRADVGISDAWTIKQFAAAHPKAVKDLFASNPFNIVGAGWFVNPGEAQLIQFLNSSIDWLESSGTIADIATHYELPSFLEKHQSQP